MGDGRAEGLSAVEMEGKLQFHSHLMLMYCTFAFLKVHNMKVHMEILYCVYCPLSGLPFSSVANCHLLL